MYDNMTVTEYRAEVAELSKPRATRSHHRSDGAVMGRRITFMPMEVRMWDGTSLTSSQLMNSLVMRRKAGIQHNLNLYGEVQCHACICSPDVLDPENPGHRDPRPEEYVRAKFTTGSMWCDYRDAKQGLPEGERMTTESLASEVTRRVERLTNDAM